MGDRIVNGLPLGTLVLIIFIISAPNVFAASVEDPSLIVEEYVTGILSPTSIDFIGNDLLVLEKNTGKVLLVRDGVIQPTPALDVAVANHWERGMLGIESVGNDVYLFYTPSTTDGGSPLSDTGNHVYKYTWDGNNLINPVFLKAFSTTPGASHNGGVMTKDSSGNVFVVMGDTERDGPLQNFDQNHENHNDDTSVIMQINPPGPYLAMGIRNSFGLTTDPITGYMWDTENGLSTYDEINMIPPKFNSGWEVVQGPATQQQIDSIPGYEDFVYDDPEFSFSPTIGITGIWFMTSSSFPNYSDSVFVGDCNNDYLYKFELNQSRDGFVFNNSELSDLVRNPTDDFSELVWGDGFGCTTDIETGPDGYLYVVSIENETIYRIIPDGNSVCGDGVIEGAETCDDNDTTSGDGCSDVCEEESGWTCTGEPSSCTEDPVCGNDVIEDGETCDDGGANGTPGSCNITCDGIQPHVCGDGLVTGSETCDDNDTTSGDGCSDVCEEESGWTCTGEPSSCTEDQECGNGVIEGAETCDDNDTTSGDGCSDVCEEESGWTCTGEPSSCTEDPVCGNDVIEDGETCDDGGANGTPGSCNITCDGIQPHVCGDGLVTGSETCDDNDTTSGDGCSDVCEEESGWTCTGEPSSCTEDPVCGNGVVENGETCDDNDTTSGDGCSDVCEEESGWTCTGEPSSCIEDPVCGNGVVENGETCDDNDTTSGDGCSDVCEEESGWTCTGEPSVCCIGDQTVVDGVCTDPECVGDQTVVDGVCVDPTCEGDQAVIDGLCIVPPIITDVINNPNEIQIFWTQDPPVAPSFDIIIDGVDTNLQYRTTSSPQTVDSGECFEVQARYPSISYFVESDEVCADPICIGDQTLVDGTCVDPECIGDQTVVEGVCTDPECIGDQIVVDGICTDPICIGDQTLIDGVCVDPTCAENQVVIDGVCEYTSEIVLQAEKDNTIFDEDGTKSCGACNSFFVGVTNGDNIRRALIEFDVSSIPPGSTIANVEFEFAVSKTTDSDSRIMYIHKVTEEWGEEDSVAVPPGFNKGEGNGGPALSGDATWTDAIFDDTVNWTSPGGDFTTLSSVSVNLNGAATVPAIHNTPSTASMVADVQSWVDNLSSNHGWILKLDSTDEGNSGTARAIDSRTNILGTPPILRVTFGPSLPDSDGDGVPNGSDNCPTTHNPGQEDNYGTIAGDACEDTDADSILDDTDNCPIDENTDQKDLDMDNIGDACDSVNEITQSKTVSTSHSLIGDLIINGESELELTNDSNINLPPGSKLVVEALSGFKITPGSWFSIS